MYWHKLQPEEFDALMRSSPSIEDILRDYKQPDWCTMVEAVHPIDGCEDLTGEGRTDISRRYCKGCPYCKVQIGLFGV